MPRVKTIQPPPLQTFTIDGQIFEVRDETCEIIGRGMHTVAAHNKIFNKVLPEIAEEYFWGDKEQQDHIRRCCKSDHALAVELQNRGTPREFRSLVKLAKEIRREFLVLESALKSNNIKHP